MSAPPRRAAPGRRRTRRGAGESGRPAGCAGIRSSGTGGGAGDWPGSGGWGPGRGSAGGRGWAPGAGPALSEGRGRPQLLPEGEQAGGAAAPGALSRLRKPAAATQRGRRGRRVSHHAPDVQWVRLRDSGAAVGGGASMGAESELGQGERPGGGAKAYGAWGPEAGPAPGWGFCRCVCEFVSKPGGGARGQAEWWIPLGEELDPGAWTRLYRRGQTLGLGSALPGGVGAGSGHLEQGRNQIQGW